MIVEVETDEGLVGVGETDYLKPSVMEFRRNINSFFKQNPFDLEPPAQHVYEQGVCSLDEGGGLSPRGTEMALWDIVREGHPMAVASLVRGAKT